MQPRAPSRTLTSAVRLTVKAGTRTVGVAFLQRDGGDRRAASEAVSGRQLQSLHRQGGRPASNTCTISGPYNGASARRTRRRPARRIFTCHPRTRADERPCAERILSQLARRAYRRPPAAIDVDDARPVLRRGARAGDFGGGIEAALAPAAGRPGVPVPRRARSRRPPPHRHGVPDQRPRAGVAPVVLPLEQHPGRRAARAGGARPAARARACSSSRSGGCSRTRGRAPWSPTSPPSGCTSATCGPSRPTPTCSRSSTTTCATRSSGRPSCSSNSQLRDDRSVVDLLTRRLHLRQRAAGAPLRHPQRLRQPLPPRDASRRSAAPACSATAAS